MRQQINKLWKENRFFLVFIVLMLMFRSAIADWNDVPTGSMLPTIVEGDRIYVDKMAYDIRAPFTHLSLIHRADPERGDIIIFDSKKADKRLVKRVVGLPGDIISMDNNEIFINGEVLNYSDLSASTSPGHVELTEHLNGIDHKIRIQALPGYASSFSDVEVPEGHYLALGDNRDNSSDSRSIGFIPRDEIVGKSTHVVLSMDYNNYFIPRKERFLKTL